MSNTNIFRRGFSVNEIYEELDYIFKDVSREPFDIHSLTNGFSKSDQLSYKFLTTQVIEYLEQYRHSGATEEFKIMGQIYVESINYYIGNIDRDEEEAGYFDKLLELCSDIFKHLDNLPDEYLQGLSYAADAINTRADLLGFECLNMRLFNSQIYKLNDLVFEQILKSMYTNNRLCLYKLIDLDSLRDIPDDRMLRILDCCISSFLTTNHSVTLSKPEEILNALSWMSVAYLQSAITDEFKSSDLGFKLMACFSMIGTSCDSDMAQMVALNDLMDTVGTAIYGTQYGQVKNFGLMLGIKQDVAFWKDAFQGSSIKFVSEGLPENIV